MGSMAQLLRRRSPSWASGSEGRGTPVPFLLRPLPEATIVRGVDICGVYTAGTLVFVFRARTLLCYICIRTQTWPFLYHSSCLVRRVCAVCGSGTGVAGVGATLFAPILVQHESLLLLLLIHRFVGLWNAHLCTVVPRWAAALPTRQTASTTFFFILVAKGGAYPRRVCTFWKRLYFNLPCVCYRPLVTQVWKQYLGRPNVTCVSEMAIVRWISVGSLAWIFGLSYTTRSLLPPFPSLHFIAPLLTSSSWFVVLLCRVLFLVFVDCTVDLV